MEEILRNGSVIRPELFPPPPAHSIRYEYGKTTCSSVNGTITATAKSVLKRKFLIPGLVYVLFFLWRFIRSNQPLWASFEKKKRYAEPGTLAHTTLNWWYSENFCLENNTNQLHIYTNNRTRYLYLSNATAKLRIPQDVSNYRHALRVFVHLGEMPSNRTTFDNLYVFINRGWNNMYHHSETAIQLVRYALFAPSLPPVGAVCS